jgi:hypothetical protein
MSTKKENPTEKKDKVKVGNLKLNKETVKDLADAEAKKIKGGLREPEPGSIANSCYSCSRCYGC